MQVYVALSALEPPPDITESIVITTKLLAEKSAPLTKEFVEQLSKSVRGGGGKGGGREKGGGRRGGGRERSHLIS